MKRVISKRVIIIIIIVILIFVLIGLVSSIRSIHLDEIKGFYADPERPAFAWDEFTYIEKHAPYKIIKTSYNPLSPKFAIVYGYMEGKKPEYNITYVDIIKFKRDNAFRLIGDEIVQTEVKGRDFEQTIELVKSKDILTINDDKIVHIYKNPTKEEWMKKLNEEKLVLRHSISNPSKTDSVDFSVSGDLEKNEIMIKSLGKDMREFGITFNEYQRMLDKEGFTYWVNDDEFIFLINNFNGKKDIFPTFNLIKDYKDGIYTFNTKTKEIKMFIPITEPDRNYRVDYELTKDKIIIFTSNKTYTYDKAGKQLEVLNN